ncbi:hypothetical protein [Cupriavidus necator]|nr:hypothetical protein [Cupriavidus necator]MDX6014725.1 hypothetical protein [Cupriavidus necator]
MNRDPIIVMQHQGVSYIKLDYYMRAASIIVNGEHTPAVCPGNQQWAMHDGIVESLAIKQPSQRVCIGWRLSDKYRGVVQFPETLEPDAITYDHDEEAYQATDATATYHPDFYEQVIEERQASPVAVEFLVIDRDCQPITQPADVTVDFPHSLREYPATWHRHPVSISGEALFARAADVLVAAVAARPNDFVCDDHRSIGTVTLHRYMNHEPRTREYKVGRRTRRDTQTRSRFEVMKLSKPRSSYTEGALVPPTLKAENWLALEPKINEFVNLVLSYIEPSSVGVCPHCAGDGFLLNKAA